jgi:hypothetical protein
MSGITQLAGGCPFAAPELDYLARPRQPGYHLVRRGEREIREPRRVNLGEILAVEPGHLAGAPSGRVAGVSLLERTKSVAHAADRLKRGGTVAHFLSQAADDRLDDVGACARPLVAPHLAE